LTRRIFGGLEKVNKLQNAIVYQTQKDSKDKVKILMKAQKELKVEHERFRNEESVDAYFYRITHQAREEGSHASA